MENIFPDALYGSQHQRILIFVIVIQCSQRDMAFIGNQPHIKRFHSLFGHDMSAHLHNGRFRCDDSVQVKYLPKLNIVHYGSI